MSNRTLAAGALACLLLPQLGFSAATVTIINNDAPGVGFNDATAAIPVGGNNGTTLGQQRLIVYQAAAAKWGATLSSVALIRITARWSALACNATGAVLGSAGAQEAFADFVGAPLAGHFYHDALADKLFGANLGGATAEISSNFNVNLGKPGCLTGVFFYLGLDNNYGNNIDLITALLHEFAHGLGFATTTNGSNGSFYGGLPSVADHFLLDNTTGKLWDNMTAAERVASAINDTHLVWAGTNVGSAAVNTLGVPQITVATPPSVAGPYNNALGEATFGPRISIAGISGEVMPAVDTAGNLSLACNPLSAGNVAGVSGKIALLDRGTCTFAAKTKNAQNAGALGVILINNAAGPPTEMTGTDPSITIPTLMVSQADGAAFKAAVATRTRTKSPMSAVMFRNNLIQPGLDASGRIMMYAPNPFSGGSSVSHYDSRATPDQLMEPAITSQTHEVTAPFDLTFALLRDIGW